MVKAMESWPSAGVTEVMIGAPGIVAGVAEVADEAVPFPMELIARSLML